MADTLIANAMIPVPWAKGDEPSNPGEARLKQTVLQTGDTVPAGAFSKTELDDLKASGAVVAENEFVSDEEKHFASSLSALDAYRAGKQAQLLEDNPDATEEEIDKTGRVIVHAQESPVVQNKRTSPAGPTVAESAK